MAKDAGSIEWVYIAVPIALVVLLLVATVFAIRRAFRMKRIDKYGWGLICFWGLIAVQIVSNLVEQNKTPEQRAEEIREAEQNKRLSYSPDLVKMAVKKLLRDPDSAKFGQMSVYGDRKLSGKEVTVICGSVNAKNGLGGYGGDKNFVFVKDTYTTAIDSDRDNAIFVALWNGLCAGKHN